MSQVKNPKRILTFSLEDEDKQLTRVVKDLTGSAPKQPLAGSSHSISLKTRYYEADVPIWMDLIASAEEWATSFLSDEASEVLDVLGGLVLVFAIPRESSDASTSERTRDLITNVGKVVQDGLGGWDWDGVRLAVGVGPGNPDEWDEMCAEVGMEFVQLDGDSLSATQLQDFGGKMGIERVKEALEANDWELGDTAASDGEGEAEENEGQDDTEADDLDFGIDKKDMEQLRKAIWGDADTSAPPPTTTDGQEDDKTEEEDVAKVEAMMRKLQTARDAGEGLSEEQRKKMAIKAVAEVMKDF